MRGALAEGRSPVHASRRDRDRGLGIVGKIAVITGAGRGIGRATAILFARWGARVVAVAIDPDLLEALAEAIQGIGGEAEMAVADVCAHDSPCHPICQALDASRAGEYFPFASPGKSEYKIP